MFFLPLHFFPFNPIFAPANSSHRMDSDNKEALKEVEQSPEADFFSKEEYKSKKDIINAVTQYNKNCHRAFKVFSSNNATTMLCVWMILAPSLFM
jgi:hypothetical protein